MTTMKHTSLANQGQDGCLGERFQQYPLILPLLNGERQEGSHLARSRHLEGRAGTRLRVRVMVSASNFFLEPDTK